MLQRSSLPSTSTTDIAQSLPQALPQTLRRAWDRPQLRALEQVIPLPETWQQYLMALVVIGVIAGGLVLHILLSVQIAQAEFEVRSLRQEVSRIERVNSELVYEISQRSNLERMAQLAEQRGYVPATDRTFVIRSPQQGAPNAQAAPQAQAGSPGGGWLAPLSHWWQQTQQSAGDAFAQFQRDVTGRMK